MNPQNNPHKTINLLELSDKEKTAFIQQARKVLRQKLEEAKFWRTLAQNDQIIIKGLPAAFDESNLPPFEQASSLNFS